MTLTIREATKDDVETLFALHDTILRQHAAWYPSRFKYPVAPQLAARYFRRVLRGRNDSVLLAFVNGAAVGYLWYEVFNTRGDAFHHGLQRLFLHHVFVVPEHQKHGIGRALIERLRQAAAAGGQSEIVLDTMAMNRDAHGFFERQGFSLESLSYRLETKPD